MTSRPTSPENNQNPVCTALGKKLKQLRISSEISQQDLANTAEVDRTYISEIERGIGNPSILTLANICYALGITLAELFEEMNVVLHPGNAGRRANKAQPRPKPKPKSRLR